MDLSAIHDVPRRRLLTVTGVTGIAFTLSWIAGLAIPAPSPKLTASGTEITAALAGHGTAVAAQFAVTEGLPAAGLAIISVALARAAGAQKVVPDLPAALRRVEDHCLPLESARAQVAYGQPSAINRLLILNAEPHPGRGIVLLLRQATGF